MPLPFDLSQWRLNVMRPESLHQYLQPLLLLLLCFLSVRSTAQQTTRLIPFQARLSDSSGRAVPDGIRLVQFRIFGEPAGGIPLWSGEIHRLTVNAGMVNVQLGTKNPLPTDRADDPARSFFDSTLFLQVTVDGDSNGLFNDEDVPMSPRQAIVPVVFANESGNSRKLQGFGWQSLVSNGNPETGFIDGKKLADSSVDAGKLIPNSVSLQSLSPHVVDLLVPKGAILMWSGIVVPPGWALCDGNNGTPNLRDRFVLGTGDLGSIGISGGTASHRHAAGTLSVPSHVHDIAWSVVNAGGGDNFNYIEEGSGHPNFRRPNTVVGSGRLKVEAETADASTMPPFYRLAFIIKL